MVNSLPNRIIFNGVNASEGKNRGSYLLAMNMDELKQAALGKKIDEEHRRILDARVHQAKNAYGIGFGIDANDLAQVGWGALFPGMLPPARREAIHAALKELLDWRKSQAGDLYKEFFCLPNENVNNFITRNHGAPGTVDDLTVRDIPYYLLIVGGPDEIPYRFQYELDVFYLVGRISFDTIEEYARYAHSVVEAEKNPPRLARRTVFFGSAHEGDAATQLSSETLVAPLAQRLAERKPNLLDWQVERIPPEEARKDCLTGLLGRGSAPALLFTATHGVGFNPGDPMQIPFQGSLLCQDLERIGPQISRDHYLGAEDIADDFNLHGLVTFHFACYGAGTPQFDNFIQPGKRQPARIAECDFIAGLPKRLLSHPRGGALAVIGHIDRAWTYSFKWGQTGEQTATFRNCLLSLMNGGRVGLGLDQFNSRYAQIAVLLSNMVEVAGITKTDPMELAWLWAANNDARDYALLGDPAVRLAIANKDELPKERAALMPITTPPVILPEKPPVARKPREKKNDGKPYNPPVKKAQKSEDATALGLQLQTIAEQLNEIAGELGQPPVVNYEAEAFATPREAIEDLTNRLREALKAVGEQVKNFAENVSTLEVRTYTSEDLDAVVWKDGKLTGKLIPCALTFIALDGDTQMVVPTNAGQVNQALWEAHSRAVEQAQANRLAALRALADMLTNLLPTGK